MRQSKLLAGGSSKKSDTDILLCISGTWLGPLLQRRGIELRETTLSTRDYYLPTLILAFFLFL